MKQKSKQEKKEVNMQKKRAFRRIPLGQDRIPPNQVSPGATVEWPWGTRPTKSRDPGLFFLLLQRGLPGFFLGNANFFWQTVRKKIKK